MHKSTRQILIGMTVFALGANFATSQAVYAQDTAAASPAAFPDVPQNHWAYQAVQDLADKGLVKGYPNSQFLGKRALTRYEFATVVDRILQTIADLKNNQAPTPAPQVTQDDLNKIQVLVDTFQTQLTQIQSDVKKAQDDITSLRQQVLATKEIANKAQDTANNSYGVGANRKFAISGYIQTRYIQADSDNQARFPHGTPAANSPYNGNYMQNGNSATFQLRRSRIKFTGALTANTKYAIQLDASGVANPAISTNTVTGSGNLSSSATAVSVREGNVSYTFGDGSAKYPTLTAGMFANPFGYVLPLTQANALAPERPLAFNEGGNGLWAGQDYERGVQISYPRDQFKFTVALVNGTGNNSNDVDRQKDQIYRIAYQSTNKVLGVGVSYDHGELAGTGTGAAYRSGARKLTGVDAQITLPTGPFLLGEYLEGKFEQRSYFASPTAVTVTTQNPALGNKVAGYYVQGGYTFAPTGNHPFTLAASYDVLQRSKSGLADSGSSYDDKNLGYGLLYNLDKATRLRVWYNKPSSVAHLAGTLEPPKYGLFTTELQVKF